jgi:Molecular chaperone GrpE (heat shock protein)
MTNKTSPTTRRTPAPAPSPSAAAAKPSPSNGDYVLDLSDLERELEALPSLWVEGDEEAEEEEATSAAATAEATPDPLQIVARQGRLILRLSAAAEGLDARYRELSEQQRAVENRVEEAREEARLARQQVRKVALEAVHLMDALDWVYEALEHRGDPLAAQVASARRDCLRRLAAVGINEIPASSGGVMDGRLHEGLESISAPDVPQYHIITVVRPGYQMGADVLRRAEVTTAE